MSYKNTFVKCAEDCPVDKSEIPLLKKDKPPQHLIQYELLTQHPYKYDHEGLIFEVYVRYKEIPAEVLKKDKEYIKKELFSKGHPCMRASALTKRYGFGAHYNEDGKIALYPMESKEYENFIKDKEIQKVPAMKTKR